MMGKKADDPLGIQPPPLLGDPVPDYADRVRSDRVDAAVAAVKPMWINHRAADAVISQLVGYVRQNRDARHKPMDGRRLSEHSNAGKSRTIERLVEELAGQRAAEGLPPNPHQVVVVELDRSTSVRSFYRQILLKMGDDHWNDNSAKTDELEERIDHYVGRLGTELLVGDEIQHLDRLSNDASQVTDRLKTFCNRGIVPLALIGDETSLPFFAKNPKFAARLGLPLSLKPLDVVGDAADRRAFLDILNTLDDELVARDATTRRAGLAEPGIRTPLARASDGHVGRVVRIVKAALEHALWRGAEVIEPHDLSVVVRQFAIGLKWIGHDPFSKRG